MWPRRSAGTLGIGDPYYPRFGNGGYDVEHYDLAIRYGPGTNHLRGVATITAQTTQDLSCFSLDLVGLTVSAVTVNGDPATRSRTHHELMITPAAPLASGADLTVVVTYDGFPKGFVIPSIDAVSGFIRTADGVVIAGEPEAATAWFPVNDHPTDRASYTFRVTVPNGYEVVANGVPESEDTRGNWTTHVWQAHDPMASYLATFNVGEWTMRSRVTSNGVPVIDAIDPDVLPLRASLRAARAGDPHLPRESVRALPVRVGGRDLPRHPTARVRPRDADQTDLRAGLLPRRRLGHRARAGAPVVRRPGLGASLAGHLAQRGLRHVRRVAVERARGVRHPSADLRGHLEGDRRSTPRSGTSSIGDPGVEDLFDGAVYVRGAMTVQALRDEVGDDAFWTILHTWTETHAFGTGSTEEFIALAEQVSGRDLGDLFDVWLFTPSRPPASAVTGSGEVSASPAATDHATSWLRAFVPHSAP